MKRKNIIIVFLILITIIVIGVILYFHAQNYSLLDIDASNYSSKLKEIEASVEESEINNCIPDKINIFRSNLFLPTSENGREIEKDSVNGLSRVQITSSNTDLYYLILFHKDKGPIKVSIEGIKPNKNNPLLKEICDNLVLNKGFIKKQTYDIRGWDILIKETPSCFLIVEVLADKDNAPEAPFMIHLKTFSKKKYF